MKVQTMAAIITVVLVSCKSATDSQETKTAFLQDTANAKTRMEGILIYGDNLHEFKDTETKEVYYLKDNSHSVRTKLKDISSVDYQPLSVTIEIDSIGLPQHGNALNYKHVIYLHKILSIREEIAKQDNVTKDTSIANDKKGISFKAMGNEPFWSIIIREKEISFSTNIGQTESFTYQNARRYHKSNVIEVSNDAQNKIYVIISDEPCFDNMSGREFGNRVKLIYNNNTTYYGCGNFVEKKK